MPKMRNDFSYEYERNGYGDPEADKAPILVVLKVQMHCGSCVENIRKSVLDFPGVEMVKMEPELNRVIVVGSVNPCAVRENLKRTIDKEVELVSPRPDKEKRQYGYGKSKEPPVRTAVLKIKFHCEGCSEKIRRTVTKTRGVYNVSMDKVKEQVTIQGTMDMEEVKERLREKLKRGVEVVAVRRLTEDKGSNKHESGGREWDCGSVHCGHWWVPVHHVNGFGCTTGQFFMNAPPQPVPSGAYLGLFSEENANSCSIL